MSNKELTDSMLQASARRVRNSMLAALPEPEACQHYFSHRFELRMQRLIKRNRKRMKYSHIIRNIAAILVFCFMGTFMWFISASEAQADFMKWIRELFSGTVVYQFFGEDLQRELPEYSFSWLPDGFSQEIAENDPDFYIIVATDTDGNAFVLEYHYMDEGSNLTESAEGDLIITTVTVHELPAHFYSDSMDDAPSELVWMENDIVFRLSSNMEEEIIITVAESIVKSK